MARERGRAHRPVRKAASCVASQSFSVRVRAVLRAVLRAVPRMADRVSSAAVRIPQAQHVRVTRHVRGCEALQDCRRRVFRPSRPGVREGLRAVRDSVISMDLKKVR